MKEKLLNALTLLVAAGLVAVIGLSLFNYAGATPPASAVVDNWRQVASGGTPLGGAEAPVKVVVFSDFQCRYCAQSARELKQLRDSAPGQLAITFRHLPLEAIHPHAVAAAMASECAAEQGRFEAFHDLLFDNQQAIGVKPWTEFAAAAGVPDTESFGRCVREERHRDRVTRDLEMAGSLGVAGTPTFMVNGRVLRGSGTSARLAELVREAQGQPAQGR